jgi:hypothetical protein
VRILRKPAAGVVISNARLPAEIPVGIKNCRDLFYQSSKAWRLGGNPAVVDFRGSG